MNKKKWIAIIVVGWLLAIGGFLIYMESAKANATDVYLETRPVDPRDFLRGDYVILAYDIERQPLETNLKLQAGDTVWAVMSETNPAAVTRLSATDPQETAIRATVSRIRDGKVNLDLSQDAFYIPVGTGRDLPQQPWTVHLKVFENGNAVVEEVLKDGTPIIFKK